MKMTALLLIGFSTLLLTACGSGPGSSGSGQDTNVTEKGGRASLEGRWLVRSLVCGDVTLPTTSAEIEISRGASFISLITVTENSATRRCKRVDGYSFAITSSSRTEIDGAQVSEVEGELQLSAVRTACWVGGESKPSQDDTQKATGPLFHGKWTQSDSNQLKFVSEKSPTCGGKSTAVELVRK